MTDLPSKVATVLIVDDELAVRQLLFEILSPAYECSLASSAEEALGKIGRRQFNLVISDINLGGMSGVELIPLIHEASPDTVVLMISGSGTIDSAIEAMRRGSFDYIKKPFDIDHVAIAVSRALDHQSLLVSKRKHEETLHQLVEERTARLRFLESYDVLTELPNRLLFEDRLGQLILGSPPGTANAVMLLSIDRLGAIRDTRGDTCANRILLEAVNRLVECVGPALTLGKIEDTVFGVILPQTHLDSVIILAERIQKAIATGFSVDGESFFVEGKIGISMSPQDGTMPVDLITNARAALSRARAISDNSTQFFTNDINRTAADRLALEADLRCAIDRQQLDVFYQPKIDVKTGTVVGAEALARWLHPGRGFVSPVDFIPLAEEIGYVGQIGSYVLERTLEDFGGASGNFKVAVNMSAIELQNKDLVRTIKKAVDASSFDPKNLNIEITESSLIKCPESAVRQLGELRESGIQISIDDFGTGYSSLSSLISLPIDVLKIDRMFIRKSAENEQDAALVRAIVELGHTLDLKVVAEGVETEEQLALLSDLGCDEFQGFLFSPPVPLEKFSRLVATGVGA